MARKGNVHKISKDLEITIAADFWGVKYVITCHICDTTAIARTKDPIRQFVYGGHGWPTTCPYAAKINGHALATASGHSLN